jgi:hypothetical protein
LPELIKESPVGEARTEKPVAKTVPRRTRIIVPTKNTLGFSTEQ